MTITDQFSGIEYNVLAFADIASTSNPDVSGEYLVEVTSPSGDSVTVSVVDTTEFLRDPEGKITVRPPVAPQFVVEEIVEEPSNG